MFIHFCITGHKCKFTNAVVSDINSIRYFAFLLGTTAFILVFWSVLIKRGDIPACVGRLKRIRATLGIANRATLDLVRWIFWLYFHYGLKV